MFKRFKNNFLTGLVIILPLILTIAVLAFLAAKINKNILNPLFRILGLHFSQPYFLFLAKGAGFFIAILLIGLIGLATKLILLRNFIDWGERLFSKVPMIGKMYTTIKEISLAFLGQGKHVFEQVVLIEFPRKGIYSLAFITAEGSQEFRQKTKSDVVHVFLPTSPNPTTGFFLLVPKEEIHPLEMTVTDAFKLIVSGGVFSLPNQPFGKPRAEAQGLPQG